MTKDLKNDSAEYSSLILKELTHDREKDVQMLQELRNKNRENGNLIRALDRLLLTFLPPWEKEEFVTNLYYEIFASNKEAITMISKGLKQIVQERDIRCDPPETWTAKYGKHRVHLTHTNRHVILGLDNHHSEFLNFAIDYFRGEPHAFQISEDKSEKIYIYHWEKKRIGRFRTTPNEIDHLFTFGSALMGHSLYSYAASRFQEILNQDPDDYETLLCLSRCLSNMGHEEFAFHYLKRAVSMKPDDPTAYRQLGDCYKELGLFGMALENLLRARDLEEDDREIHNNIGVAYAHLEENDKSIHAYRRALEIDSGFTLPWRNIGLAYQRLGRFDEAIEAYERYSELDPENQEPHVLLGEVYEEMGDLSRTIETYQRALRIRPDYSVYLSLGRIYEKVNRISDAKTSYQEALKIYPSGQEARTQLFQLGHPDMEELAEEMVQVVDEHPFLDDPDAVPVIYEEAKRRKVEREGGNSESKQDGESFGLN